MILRRLRWTSRRRTPLGGGQNETHIMCIIFWLEWAELSVWFFMWKPWNYKSLSLLTNESGVLRTSTSASLKDLHIRCIMFPLIWLKLSYRVTHKSFAAHAASTEFDLQTCCCPQLKRQLIPGPWERARIFDYKSFLLIFLDKTSLISSLAIKATQSCVTY